MKHLSPLGVKHRINESAFMWMVFSSVVQENFKFGEIIEYWYELAFKKPVTINHFYDAKKLVNNIRKQLLLNAGIKKPILQKSKLWDQILTKTEINFTFKEPTTILNKQFEENNGKANGDEENEIKDDNGKPLDGDSLDYQLPFEQIVYERLTDQFTNEVVNVQYGAIIKEDLEPANPKPHVFYNINTESVGTNLAFIDDLGNKNSLNSNRNIPSHTMTLYNVEFSTVFSEEFSEYTNIKITNTLYKNYHKDFIDSLFNVKRRNYKFKARLPFRILSNLELNDIFKIRDNYYRISNYNLNLLTGDAELNLISSFDAVIGGFIASNTNLYVDYTAQIQSIYITNLGLATFNKVDNGFGIDWVSVSSNLNNVYFSIALNETGLSRDVFVDITNEAATKTIRVYINQTRLVVGKLDFSNSDNIVLNQVVLT